MKFRLFFFPYYLVAGIALNSCSESPVIINDKVYLKADLGNSEEIQDTTYNKQIEYLTETLNKEPNIELYYHRAKLNFLSGKFNQAERDLSHVLISNQVEGQHYLLNAQILKAKNEYGEAIAQANKAYHSDLKSFDLLIILGELYYANEDTANALQFFQEAQNLLSNNIVLLCNIGNIYQALNDTSEALKHFKKALSINQNYQNAYKGIFQVYKSNSQLYNTNLLINEILEKLRPDAELSLMIGEYYYEENRQEQAISWFQHVYEADPKIWQASYAIAKYYIKRNEFSKAEEYYVNAVRYKTPKEAQDFFQLGYIYEFYMNNKLSQAEKYYSEAKSLEDNNKDIQLALQRVELKLRLD